MSTVKTSIDNLVDYIWDYLKKLPPKERKAKLRLLKPKKEKRG